MILTIYYLFTFVNASEYVWSFVIEVFWSLNSVLIIFGTTIFGQLTRHEVKVITKLVENKILADPYGGARSLLDLCTL